MKLTTDRTVLKDEILNILIAGRDTTAATLTFAFYLLSQHPDATDRLRQEVLEHVGPNARPTHETITNMKYLRAFINGQCLLRLMIFCSKMLIVIMDDRNSSSVPGCVSVPPFLSTQEIYSLGLIHAIQTGEHAVRLALGRD